MISLRNFAFGASTPWVVDTAIKRCLCDRIGPVSDFDFEHGDAPLPSCDCSGAWHETELLHNGKRVRHDGVFEDFAVTNGVNVDRHPLDAIARAGTSEELPAMRATKAIENYDLVAFRDNVEHLGSRVGDRLIEHLVELSPSTGSDLGAVRREG